ncbi:orotidine-5'-phosphate decarboxylase [Pedobacter sp. UYP30]|uniref:orotidine-5'-phosphate decarboxylase n=1 Tax=Pedobacter sp. UYP30 TaxID=1756400 RepID=UPI0033956356
MTKQQLFAQIKLKRSFLCVGLDPDLDKIPKHLLRYNNPILEFNKQIIAATADVCIAYKPNTAFYECCGLPGWEALIETCKLIPDEIFTIADAKRGDIGNTSTKYAQTFFNGGASPMDFDAVTVAPYMGSDSVLPFLNFKNKWVILLALTSNEGHKDFQLQQIGEEKLFEMVLKSSLAWGSDEQLMYVVGATRGKLFEEVRKIIPKHFLLVPGVGAQGGSLQDVCKYGLNDQCGLLVNSSRGIIYASKGEDFAEKAREAALEIQLEMEQILIKRGLVG